MTDDDDLDHDPGAAADTRAARAVSPQQPSQAAIPAAAQRGQDMARDIARTGRRDGSCRAPDNTVDPAGLLGFITHRDTQRRRRRRTVAAGTATAVLAGAAVFWIGVEPFGPPAPRPAVTVPAQTWTDRAQVTLVSISYQLDQIDQTTQVWNTQIADQYQGMPTPAPVAAMLARKVLLEQQRAILTSELATAHELDQARAELATLDQQIATLSSALTSSTPSNTAAGQADAVAGLRAARTLAEQMRTAKQAEVDRLTAGMRSAEQTPMPERIDQTTPVIQAVLNLDTRRHPDPSRPGQSPPGVAPGGPDGRRPTQQVTTGQPIPSRSEPLPVEPSTRGTDGNTSTGIGRAVTTAAAGAVHTIDNTAQKILTPGGGHGDNGSTTGGHRGKPTENTPGGAVSGATHTVTGAVGAVADTAEQLIAPSGNPHSNDNHRGGNRTGGTTEAAGGGRDKTGGSVGSTATRTVTGAVDKVGATAQNVLSGSNGSTGSGTATGRHRATTSATPTGATATNGANSRSSGGKRDSAGSRAAQLQYAAQVVKSVPGGTWASGAIAMAQQVSSDIGSDGTGSSDSATPRYGGGSGSARASTQASTTGSGSTWGSSWSAHPTTSAASSTNSRASGDSASSSERTSSSSSSSPSSSSTSTGSATGSGGAGGSSSSPASSDGGASSW